MRFILVFLALLWSAVPALAARNLLVFGDSLSAGYGIRPSEAWPSLLQARLTEKRLDYNVVNASVSGETTAGGRSRFSSALQDYKPAVVVIALGANDGLRGLPLSLMKENLRAMAQAARDSGARVMLVGMRLPPNYGPYASQFSAVFAEVAESTKAPLVDFLLAGIASDASAFQPDMLHPTAAAQPKLLENVWPSLAPLLK